ncbi:MAG TPA: PfkB family carbohydrate kinase [Phycisphaerae bacterium]|nr:PfkB family carbohydrate kinase [Phycisphaerae bacterium]HRY68093.1 PfkB family carbohydrate kinase [Phycisphaerae bacterium]HSA29061.1 PfkB family carbohydrate kinase [Phycisphaerae bacterium]
MRSHVPQLTDAIRLLSGAKVGIVGDLVADLYVSGRSDRVSREAPVLIVCHEDEWLRPGGAANVAANVAALGGVAHLVGLVGDDDPGRRLLASLGESGAVRCGMVVVTRGRDTITKTRFLAGAKLTSRQQVLRLDRQPADPPEDRLRADLRARVERVDAEVDAWVASDYGYGSFDEPLRALLRQIAGRKPVVADSRWELARFTGMSVIKPNEEEAEAVARQLGLQAGEVAMLAAALAGRLEARSALVTLGNQGMVLVTDGRTVRIPASGSDEIVDLTGAGDSVAATLTAALAGGADIETAARLANHAGGVVVMKEGAATVSPAELAAAVKRASAAG